MRKATSEAVFCFFLVFNIMLSFKKTTKNNQHNKQQQQKREQHERKNVWNLLGIFVPKKRKTL